MSSCADQKPSCQVTSVEGTTASTKKASLETATSSPAALCISHYKVQSSWTAEFTVPAYCQGNVIHRVTDPLRSRRPIVDTDTVELSERAAGSSRTGGAVLPGTQAGNSEFHEGVSISSESKRRVLQSGFQLALC